MSRFRKGRILFKAGLMAGGLAAAIGLVAYTRWILRIDPFEKYRPQESVDDSKKPAITYKDIEFALYDDKGQIGTCQAKEVNVGKDRQEFHILGVTNGKMASEEGGFGFESAEATYYRRTQVLSALKGARVWNPEVDLDVDGFSYYQRTNLLQTVGKVSGEFYGGEITAYNLRWDTVDKSATAGPIEWTGSLAKFNKDAPILQGSTKPWSIKGDKFAIKGDEWTYTKGRATDGDVILLADQVTHNKKTDVVTATGNVQYFSAKANMACEKAVIYRKEKRAVLTGNVTMLVKPKEQEKLEETVIPPFRPAVPESIASGRPAPPTPEEKAQNEEVRKNNLRKYPTQVWAEKIEYWYAKGSRRAVVTGSPQARQDLPNGRWRHIWTHTAKFDVEADQLRLESEADKRTVRLITSIGDDLTAKWLRVSTKDGGEDDMEGEEVEGTVISDDDDVNNRTKNPLPTTGGGNGGLKGKIGA